MRNAVGTVLYLHFSYGLPLKPTAFEEAAEYYGLSASAVEKAYYKLRGTRPFDTFEADAKGDKRDVFPSAEFIMERQSAFKRP